MPRLIIVFESIQIKQYVCFWFVKPYILLSKTIHIVYENRTYYPFVNRIICFSESDRLVFFLGNQRKIPFLLAFCPFIRIFASL